MQRSELAKAAAIAAALTMIGVTPRNCACEVNRHDPQHHDNQGTRISDATSTLESLGSVTLCTVFVLVRENE